MVSACQYNVMPRCSNTSQSNFRLCPTVRILSWSSSRLFFFFQAEDGIRDSSVTGVQTCALPILGLAPEYRSYGGNPALVYQRPHWNGIQALTLHQVYALNVNLMQHPSQRLVDEIGRASCRERV